MPFIKVWVHFVWSSKNREPILNSTLRKKVFQHTLLQAREKGIHLDTINGYDDHVHCLVSMGQEQNLSEIARLIKGESSHWINDLQLIDGQFAWQEEYFAASVGESIIGKVRRYIQRQEEHHKTMSFVDECAELSHRYGFKMDSLWMKK